jgi:cytochrome c-type biogenesis protein CcmH
LLIALPLGAISLYWFTGNQQVWEALRASDEYNKQLAELKSITAQLVSRLESHPQDGEAWSLLGRAYMSQEEFPQAQRAFAKAYLLLPHNDPDLLADYAESIFMANDAHSTQLSSGLLYQALKLKPDHTRSLSLAGMAAYQANDFKRAIFYWQKLAKQVPDNSEMQSFLQSFIARAQTRINETANTLSTKIGKVAAIHVRVQIDPGLKAMISGSETLFVFAKAVGGPPMPFAVVRRTVRDLPLDVVLDDSTAMMPNARLSSFDQVIIGARVSASGTATPQKGDLEGTSGPVKVGGSPVRIVINRAVP